ncbi:MAG: hypothetical protein KGI50_01730 [Patescibacteria group bacterium]|nr:hypothetical protein [Patescibacteria group bacterium]MDE2437936.1 hypothetical protein [Patescibacteria group bacterium]
MDLTILKCVADGCLMLVSGVLLTSLTSRKKEEKEEKKQDLTGFMFGLAVSQAGMRSPVEHALINVLQEAGAECMLAGRNSVRGEVLDKDVIDALGISNPQFVIVGTIHENEIFLDNKERPRRTDSFYKWWVGRFPQATVDDAETGEVEDIKKLFRDLFLYYDLTHRDLYLLYTKETGQSPYVDNAKRRYALRVSLDCYASQGTVVGSFHKECEFYHEDRDKMYRQIAEEFCATLRLAHHVEDACAAEPRYPRFSDTGVQHLLDGQEPTSSFSSTRPLNEEELLSDVRAEEADHINPFEADDP